MEESAGWGAIRVLPDADPTAEVMLTGEIIESNGVELSLHITARDSTGRLWIERTYTDFALGNYAVNLNYLNDPFQDLYNKITNDLNEVRAGLSERDLNRILDTSMLRYAAALAPEAFSPFMTLGNDGRIQLVGLPARDDAMYFRASRIRESEYVFADTVDEAYQLFFNEVGQTYTFWRSYSHELILGNESLEKESYEDKQRSQTWARVENVYNDYKESRLNGDALRQMTNSFDSEVTPTVTSLAGAMIHLEGSLSARYQEWRGILQEIYASERVID
jgi:hypothetical protein